MGRMLTTKALQPPANRPAASVPNKAPGLAVPGRPVAPEAPLNSPKQVRSGNLAFYCGLVLVFTSFGVLTEALYFITGRNTYVIYVVSPAAILGALWSGGMLRTLQSRATWYWVGFSLWMLVSIPFSFWTGGSVNEFYNYVRVSLPLLFVVGGLATNWKELRTVFNTIAMAGLLSLLTTRWFGVEENGRVNLSANGSSIGNSNDLASHLIIILPFLLFVAMDRKRNPIVRFSMVLLMGYGASVILGTASRGGVIALSAVFLFVLLCAKMSQRILAVAIAGLLVAASFVLLPSATLNRLASLFGQENIEADQSKDARDYLFKTSVRYSLQHPIFGVGLGQFPNFEGSESRAKGEHGNWHATHCTWTEVSSECGIPALVFFVLAIGSAFFLVFRVWRQTRKRGLTELSNACFCYLIAMVGFLVDITFLANAYRFYLPAMIGLAISISFVAKQQLAARTTSKDQRFASMIPPQPLAIR